MEVFAIVDMCEGYSGFANVQLFRLLFCLLFEAYYNQLELNGSDI